MTFEEFKIAYQPLANKWPKEYAKPELRSAMYQSCRGFQIEWVRQLVQTILLQSDPNFNISAEIEKEKRRRGFERLNSDNAEEFERMRRGSTERGLKAELERLNASSVWEAVQKSKKMGAS